MMIIIISMFLQIIKLLFFRGKHFCLREQIQKGHILILLHNTNSIIRHHRALTHVSPTLVLVGFVVFLLGVHAQMPMVGGG